MSAYINTLPSDHKVMVDKWFTKTSADEQIKSYAYMSEHYDTEFAHARSSDRCVDMMIAHLPQDKPLRVLDAGCGTGFGGEHVRKQYADRDIHLIGMDYCPQMLEKARAKGVFDVLFEADFSHPFKLPGNDTALCDGLISSGVFFENHVEPAYMINMSMHLRDGGVAVFSIRDTFYERCREEIDQAIHDSGFDVISKERHDYWTDGAVTANYFILRKRTSGC